MKRHAQVIILLLVALPFLLVGFASPPEATLNPAPEKEDSNQKDEPDPDSNECANTLRWSTASEQQNFAFDVYRGEQEEGPFTRITSKPIPGAGTTDETTRYKYTDDAVVQGTQYYYYVESISMSGTRERFTPVIKARIKCAAASEEGYRRARRRAPFRS